MSTPSFEAIRFEDLSFSNGHIDLYRKLDLHGVRLLQPVMVDEDLLDGAPIVNAHIQSTAGANRLHPRVSGSSIPIGFDLATDKALRCSDVHAVLRLFSQIYSGSTNHHLITIRTIVEVSLPFPRSHLACKELGTIGIATSTLPAMINAFADELTAIEHFDPEKRIERNTDVLKARHAALDSAIDNLMVISETRSGVSECLSALRKLCARSDEASPKNSRYDMVGLLSLLMTENLFFDKGEAGFKFPTQVLTVSKNLAERFDIKLFTDGCVKEQYGLVACVDDRRMQSWGRNLLSLRINDQATLVTKTLEDLFSRYKIICPD